MFESLLYILYLPITLSLFAFVLYKVRKDVMKHDKADMEYIHQTIKRGAELEARLADPDEQEHFIVMRPKQQLPTTDFFFDVAMKRSAEIKSQSED